MVQKQVAVLQKSTAWYIQTQLQPHTPHTHPQTHPHTSMWQSCYFYNLGGAGGGAQMEFWGPHVAHAHKIIILVHHM